MARNQYLIELEKQEAFIRSALEKAQNKLEKQPLVVKYNNGGGQTGTRENPEWIAYEKLLKSYQATLRAIAMQQDEKAKEKTTGIGSPLLNFRDKYGSLGVAKDA